MMLRCSTVKQTGGFDERYFMYAEDVDLCRRIGEVSKTIFYPYVSIYHEYAKGSYGNRKMLMMHIKSITKYFNKWGWFLDKNRKLRNTYCVEQIKKTITLQYLSIRVVWSSEEIPTNFAVVNQYIESYDIKYTA